MKNASFALVAVILALGSGASAAPATDGSFTGAARFMERDGEAIFKNVCAGCHMPSGEGAIGAGAYPGLARNAKLRTAAYPIFMVVNGQKAMPSFGSRMDDEQIAAVVNFVRTNFGNEYRDQVSAAEVKAARR